MPSRKILHHCQKDRLYVDFLTLTLAHVQTPTNFLRLICDAGNKTFATNRTDGR